MRRIRRSITSAGRSSSLRRDKALSMDGSEGICDGHVGMIGGGVGGRLVAIVREKTTPFPGPGDARRHFVHQVGHIGLIFGAITGPKDRAIDRLDTVVKIHLP